MKQMQAAVKIIAVLQQAGHVAYLAGGCVRDRLLGLEPKDYDVATDATPQQVRKLFHKTQFVGEAFGVVLVRLMGTQVEVATFRMEWGYSDKRRPDGVVFTDAQHDAQRRDFTINGLFEDPLTGEILDYVNGQADLHARCLRAIGDPDHRFAEDYLRMLRAVRFATRFDFEIQTQTARAIRNHARYLGQISRQRIGDEIRLMLQQSTPQRTRAMTLLQTLHLDGPTLHEDSVQIELQLMSLLSDQATVATCLGAWMLDRHAQSGQTIDLWRQHHMEHAVKQWSKALLLSNRQRNELQQTLERVAEAMNWHQLEISQKKRLLAAPCWTQAHLLIEAMNRIEAVADKFAAALTLLRDEMPLLQAQGVRPDPWIGGQDLIDMGLKPGPDFGHWLEKAYDAQLEGMLHTRQQALEWLTDQINPPQKKES